MTKSRFGHPDPAESGTETVPCPLCEGLGLVSSPARRGRPGAEDFGSCPRCGGPGWLVVSG